MCQISKLIFLRNFKIDLDLCKNKINYLKVRLKKNTHTHLIKGQNKYESLGSKNNFKNNSYST